MEEQETTLEKLDDFELDHYFDFEVVEEDGFWYDNEDDVLLGIVVRFEEYPKQDALIEHFDQALREALMTTQDCDADDAQELLEEIDEEGEEQLAEYDISEKFSLFFIVDEHPGMYRAIMDGSEIWVGHSTGKRAARWSF